MICLCGYKMTDFYEEKKNHTQLSKNTIHIDE